MDVEITAEALDVAFSLAENDTAYHFDGQTCSMRTREGEDTCPICYFRRQVKLHLGLIKVEEIAQ